MATFAAVPSGAAAPTLVTDALGEGLNAIDFGVYGSGRSLAVVTNATAGSVVSQQVQTVLAVVDVAQGGGTLLGGGKSTGLIGGSDGTAMTSC